MKKYTMISLVAGIGLVAGPLSATASDFGGGWTRDKNTGTFVNTNVPTVEQQTTASTNTSGNSFGEGWMQNPTTGTSYNTNTPTVEKQHTSASKSKSNTESQNTVWLFNRFSGS